MKSKDAILEEKKMKMLDLLAEVNGEYMLKFFDIDSDEMIDDKIEVLTALKEGKCTDEIPKFYDVLELYPKDIEVIDGITYVKMWD